jgi:hypothetical protein
MPGKSQKIETAVKPYYRFFSTKKSVVWGGFFIAVLYWLVDSLFCFFISTDCDLVKTLFDPGLNNLYRRGIVLSLIVIFASHQRSKIDEMEEELDNWVSYSKSLEKGQNRRATGKISISDW